jgi:hypothetical protein
MLQVKIVLLRWNQGLQRGLLALPIQRCGYSATTFQATKGVFSSAWPPTAYSLLSHLIGWEVSSGGLGVSARMA